MKRKKKQQRMFAGVLMLFLLATAGIFGYMYLNPTRWVSINPFRLAVPVDYSVVEPWDLVVYGSEPEAISAAVVGARQGLKTLLVSPDPELGGLMTLGWLNSLDMSYDISNGGRELLTGGFFAEWWDELERPHSFQVEEALRAFQRLTAAEANLTVRLNNKLKSVEVESLGAAGEEMLRRVKLVSYAAEHTELEYRVEAPFFIDGSADGDLAAQTAAPFTLGWQDVGRPGVMMAPTLVFEVDHINWSEVMRYVRDLGDPRYGVNDDSAWAYWEIAARYQPMDAKTYLRGLNIGRQNPRDPWDQANVLINALLLFDVDVLDPAARAEALRRGEAEARRVVDFLRQEAPGFAAAEFARVAPKLYVRESRHLIGAYTLTMGDVITERHFWDEIAIGAYPVDLQAVSPTERERTLYAPQSGYGVPLRCLIPQSGPNNVLVVGRAAAYTSEAHGSARVIPVGMCTAEAAALTVTEARRSGVNDLRALVAQPQLVAQIQESIRANGGIIRPPKYGDLE